MNSTKTFEWYQPMDGAQVSIESASGDRASNPEFLNSTSGFVQPVLDSSFSSPLDSSLQLPNLSTEDWNNSNSSSQWNDSNNFNAKPTKSWSDSDLRSDSTSDSSKLWEYSSTSSLDTSISGAKLQGDPLFKATTDFTSEGNLALPETESRKLQGDKLMEDALTSVSSSKLSPTVKNDDARSNWDNVDLLFERLDLDSLEEKERADRMSRGVDALLLAKQHKIQRELMGSKYFSKSGLLPNSDWNLKGRAVEAKDMLKEKTVELGNWTASVGESTVEATSHAIGSTIGMTSNAIGSTLGMIGQMTHNLVDTASHAVDSAKYSLGIADPAALSTIIKDEERARLEKMNEGVDPILDAKKRRVEGELLHSVKPAC